MILQYKVLYTNEIGQCFHPGRVVHEVESTDGETEEMRHWVQEVLTNNCGFDSMPRSSEVEQCDAATGDDLVPVREPAPKPKYIPAFVPGRVLQLKALNCGQQT